MIPTHYILIIAGALIGGSIGFGFAALLAGLRMRRVAAREWRAARDHYLGRKVDLPGFVKVISAPHSASPPSHFAN